MVISVKQQYAGHAMRVADYAMSGLADRPPRYLVLVDEDIDPSNRDLVLWAINTRVDPAAQMHIERDRWCNAVNPAGLTPEKRAIEDYTLATVLIDACKPFRLRDVWDKMFKQSDIDESLRQQTAEKWQSVLGDWITAPKPI
jgi:4-hydroxy-3-polyprenylbenzoate decarboxylase